MWVILNDAFVCEKYTKNYNFSFQLHTYMIE